MKDTTQRIGEDIYETQFVYKGKLHKGVQRNKVVNLYFDRNECPTCDELFKSVSAFDKHRIGTIGVDRRCMTKDEMLAAGMMQNKHGFWVSKIWEDWTGE